MSSAARPTEPAPLESASSAPQRRSASTRRHPPAARGRCLGSASRSRTMINDAVHPAEGVSKMAKIEPGSRDAAAWAEMNGAAGNRVVVDQGSLTNVLGRMPEGEVAGLIAALLK